MSTTRNTTFKRIILPALVVAGATLAYLVFGKRPTSPEEFRYETSFSGKDALLLYEWSPVRGAKEYHFTFFLGEEKIVDTFTENTNFPVLLESAVRGQGRDYKAAVTAKGRFTRESASTDNLVRAPQNFGISGASQSQFTFQWDPVEGASGYGFDVIVKRGANIIYSLNDDYGYTLVNENKFILPIPDLTGGDSLIFKVAAKVNGFSDETRGREIHGESAGTTSMIDIYKTTDPSPGTPIDICFAVEQCDWIKFDQGVVLSNSHGNHTVNLYQSQRKYDRDLFCQCLDDFSPYRCLSTISNQLITGNPLECAGSEQE